MLINILLIAWSAYLSLYTITNNIETIHEIMEMLTGI